MITRLLAVLALSALTIAGAPALAFDVPSVMHFQAFLTDAAGAPIDESVSVTFRLYEGTGSDILLFEETQVVEVVEGILVAGVGAVSDLTVDVFETSETIWFELEIDGDMLEPRYPIGSVPYAMWAANALSAEEMRAALADSLLPVCTNGQSVSYDLANEQWACVDFGVGLIGPAGPQGEPGADRPARRSGPDRPTRRAWCGWSPRSGRGAR